MQGVVTFLNKHGGYGFVDGEIFFRTAEAPRGLSKGDTVEFETEVKETGHIVAKEIKKK